MTVGDELSEATKHQLEAVKQAAQALNDALDRAAHTSPADVVHGAGTVVDKAHKSVNDLLDWVKQKTGAR
jgi:hypothetical protein